MLSLLKLPRDFGLVALADEKVANMPPAVFCWNSHETVEWTSFGRRESREHASCGVVAQRVGHFPHVTDKRLKQDIPLLWCSGCCLNVKITTLHEKGAQRRYTCFGARRSCVLVPLGVVCWSYKYRIAVFGLVSAS